MTVLIAGCGDLGTEVGLRFAADGHRVVGLRRSPERLPAAIEGYAADLTHGRPEIPPDTEIVIVATTADRRTQDAYRATYVEGLSNLVDAVQDRCVRTPRFLLVSSTAVYGVTDGSRVDEDTPAVPASSTGPVLLEAERSLHARLPEAVVLRLAGLYGPGRGTLIEQVRTGTAVIPDQPRLTNRIHRDDAAAAIVHLTTEVSAAAPVYVGVDDAPVERAQVLRFLAEELGVAPPAVSPAQPGRSGNKRCGNDRLRATGFRFDYPSYREGYRAVLAGHGRVHR